MLIADAGNMHSPAVHSSSDTLSQLTTGMRLAHPAHEHPQGKTDVLDRPALSQPPLYGVLLLNDDYTPMEFVVHVLQKFFHIEQQEASRIMLQVHREGRGLCGVFVRDVAETYSSRINRYARRSEYPLRAEIEVCSQAQHD